MLIPKPKQAECTPYQWGYISLVPDNNDILGELQVQLMDTIDLVTSLDDATLLSSYAPDKWSILEIMTHLLDSERVFAYRALRFARKDKTELPGYDENLFASNSGANNRKILGIVKEFSLLRASTIELFQSFDLEMWNEIGTANGHQMKTSFLPFMACGHEIHHRNIIEERYIGK
ncbi:MAG: DinB family protein [bacterium]|nr:DinB family protein [bacterium]